MEPKKTTKPYPSELRERAVRMVREHAKEHSSEWAVIRSIAEKMGCNAETLRLWVRRSERDRGVRPGLGSDERNRLKALERENGGPLGNANDHAPRSPCRGQGKAGSPRPGDARFRSGEAVGERQDDRRTARSLPARRPGPNRRTVAKRLANVPPAGERAGHPVWRLVDAAGAGPGLSANTEPPGQRRAKGG